MLNERVEPQGLESYEKWNHGLVQSPTRFDLPFFETRRLLAPPVDPRRALPPSLLCGVTNAELLVPGPFPQSISGRSSVRSSQEMTR